MSASISVSPSARELGISSSCYCHTAHLGNLPTTHHLITWYAEGYALACVRLDQWDAPKAFPRPHGWAQVSHSYRKQQNSHPGPRQVIQGALRWLWELFSHKSNSQSLQSTLLRPQMVITVYDGNCMLYKFGFLNSADWFNNALFQLCLILKNNIY